MKSRTSFFNGYALRKNLTRFAPLWALYSVAEVLCLMTIQLNDHEMSALELYCKKYKVKNRSAFVRESIMRVVMNRFLEDYPTLFEKQELDRLVVTNNSTSIDS